MFLSHKHTTSLLHVMLLILVCVFVCVLSKGKQVCVQKHTRSCLFHFIEPHSRQHNTFVHYSTRRNTFAPYSTQLDSTRRNTFALYSTQLNAFALYSTQHACTLISGQTHHMVAYAHTLSEQDTCSACIQILPKTGPDRIFPLKSESCCICTSFRS